jgi:hypothetical protein
VRSAALSFFCLSCCSYLKSLSLFLAWRAAPIILCSLACCSRRYKTRFSHYIAILILVFGLPFCSRSSNSPDIFQEKMRDLMQGIQFTQAYMDNLLILSTRLISAGRGNLRTCPGGWGSHSKRRPFSNSTVLVCSLLYLLHDPGNVLIGHAGPACDKIKSI